jgi:hypothetical protein
LHQQTSLEIEARCIPAISKKEDDMEGLWTAEFGSATGFINGGVVMLQAGRIFGGDSGYYYVGKYSVDGETLTGELRANHYYGPRTTAFGDTTATFTVELTGTRNTTSDQIDGLVVRQGIGQVHFRLTKRATLA